MLKRLDVHFDNKTLFISLFKLIKLRLKNNLKSYLLLHSCEL